MKASDKNFVIVYRLEKDGFGPAFHPRHGFRFSKKRKLYYTFIVLDYPTDKSFFPQEKLDDFKSASFKRNFPKFYKSPSHYKSLRFACLSQQQLSKYWGQHTYRAAISLGFKIVAYKVSKEKLAILKRKKQCAFSYHLAKCIGPAKKNIKNINA